MGELIAVDGQLGEPYRAAVRAASARASRAARQIVSAGRPVVFICTSASAKRWSSERSRPSLQIASWRLKLSSLLEEDRRAGGPQHLGDGRPGGNPGRERVQPVQVAQQCPHHRDRRFALLEHPTENPLQPRRVAFGRGHDSVVEIECRAVADRDPGIVEIHPAALAGIERELFELGPGQEPVAAQMLDQILDSVAAGGDSVRGQRVANDGGAVARGVRVAADRRGVLRGVEGAPQRGATRQLAGLDDDQGVTRRAVEEAGEEPRQIVGGAAHAHHPPPA